jgi:hypothetical protein
MKLVLQCVQKGRYLFEEIVVIILMEMFIVVCLRGLCTESSLSFACTRFTILCYSLENAVIAIFAYKMFLCPETPDVFM